MCSVHLVEEGTRKSKDLGGSVRQCHVTRRICLERLKDVFLEGSYLGSLGVELVPRNKLV